MVRRVVLGGLVAILVLALTCPMGEAQQLNVAEAAKNVAEGVGVVGQIDTSGSGPVFVYEEFHTSRIGRLQTPIMLLRLHRNYGLKMIGLEGALQRATPLAGRWFHAAGGESARRHREDVAVRMLGEGEINQAEFMTLLFPGIEIYGTERADEYSVELKIKGSPQVQYLLKIAEKGLSQADIVKINGLMQRKKTNEAIDYMLSRDPWVQKQYTSVRDESARCVDRSLQNVHEIQAKALEANVEVASEVRAEMEQLARFWEVVAARDTTMVEYIARLVGESRGTPAAMIIGAAHSCGVLAALRARNFSSVQMRPSALNPKIGSLTFQQFERKNQLQWARAGAGTLGGVLNARRNPPPVIETATAKSYASLNLAALLIAEGARGGRRVPEDVWSAISSLPELRVDRSSFTRDGYDVIFRAWAVSTDGKQREVWARVGTLESAQAARDLEEKLKQAIADLGGGGIPPSKPPGKSDPAREEGPGDARRGKGTPREVVINRVNTNVLAVYARTQDEAVRVGRLSG